jgi:hypothetical protein
MVAYHELFPHDWDIVASVGSRQAWLMDMYCVRPGCACQEVAMRVVGLEEGRTWELGEALLRLGGAGNVVVARCDRDAELVVDEAIHALRIGKLLQDRMREMRGVARRLKTWRTDIAAPEKVIENLLAVRKELDVDTLDRVHALGARAVAPLVAAAGDPGAPVRSRLRAARLLAATDEPAAANALAALLAWPGLGDDVEAVEDVIHALVALREASLEALLGVLPMAGETAARVVAERAAPRIVDHRALALIAERARRDPSRWVNALMWQGHAAVPVVRQILAATMNAEPLVWEDAREALDVLEELGEEIDEDVRNLIDDAEEVAEARAEEERGRVAEAEAAHQATVKAALAEMDRRPRPGRNQPCWCGSGQKYKKCHLAADEAQRQALAQGHVLVPGTLTSVADER